MFIHTQYIYCVYIFIQVISPLYFNETHSVLWFQKMGYKYLFHLYVNIKQQQQKMFGYETFFILQETFYIYGLKFMWYF